MALPLQCRLGIVDALLQLGLLPLQTGGGTGCFANLFLQEVVLFLQILQLGAGILQGALLLLVGGDVPLHPVESLDLLPQPGKLLLGLGNGTAKATVHLGIEDELHLKPFFTRHYWISPPRLPHCWP